MFNPDTYTSKALDKHLDQVDENERRAIIAHNLEQRYNRMVEEQASNYFTSEELEILREEGII